MSLELRPITLRVANAFVARHHRHSKAVRGQKWSVGVADAGNLVGVAIAGRPVSRMLDDGLTIEILRVCTDGSPNAPSMLYGACCRAAAGMGYRVAVTYTLSSEPGTSLRAAGFVRVADVEARQWARPRRHRAERDLIGDKVRWERELAQR